ncbi:MAG: molybdotransferase-like divisome protein Glp [Sporichthyaceae bacterium]
MRSVEEYLTTILAAIEPNPGLLVPLQDAQGCQLTSDVVAAVDLPPWDNSGMDGYAVRLADVQGASEEFPAELTVLEDIAAGSVGTRMITPGTCARIMTGAPLPEGAQAVVPVELTDRGTVRVAIHAAPAEGQHIRRHGDDVRVGQVLLTAGTELGPAQIGLLAAIGVARVSVRPRPRVVVISTGSELIEPGLDLGPGQIYESNSFQLAAAARDAGAVAYRVGIVDDDEDAVLATITEQLSRADILVTSGGVSAGAYDVVKSVLSKLGTVEFGGVAMNPGKPQGFGFIRADHWNMATPPRSVGDDAGEGEGPGVPIFTLPGNPVSSYVSFEVFVRPAIRRMLGRTPEERSLVQATLTSAVSSPAGKKQFLRGRIESTGAYGVPDVTPVGGSGSHLLGGLAASNCFIVLGSDVTEVAAGAQVEVMKLGTES